MPICVGGKIIFIWGKKISKLGVDKILVNSLFVSNKKLIEKIVKTYGNQFIVIGIDVKNKLKIFIFWQ